MIKRFPFVLTAVVLICLAILISLGVWQLQRLKWKEEIIAKREALTLALPRPLVPTLASNTAPEALDMVRVEVTCPGLSQAPYEELYGVAQGQMVNRLVSPCPIVGAPYQAILVDRGYVLDTEAGRPQIIPDDVYPTKVTGVLLAHSSALKPPAATIDVDALPNRAGKTLWMARDLPGMAAALGVKDPAPYFLVAETSSNPDWKPLVPGLPPVIIRNNHLGYAFTWFALAGVLTAIYAAMLRKRLKG